MIAITANAEMLPPIAVSRPAHGADFYADHIAEAARRFGVPTSWIRAVMQAESGGNVREVSPKGAMGLMQIMPGTWTELRGRYGFGPDPFEAHDKILAGAAYLREMHDRYGAAGFLAAYNAGPARYEDYVATGRPLPDETRAYVALLRPRIASDHDDGAAVVTVAARSWIDAPLFAVHADNTRTADGPASGARVGSGSTDAVVRDLTAFAPRSAGLFARIAGGMRVDDGDRVFAGSGGTWRGLADSGERGQARDQPMAR